ncbi:MAG: TetR/AcrR family transcriptional regulator [Bacteroidales bacterium]|jgi:AcrR family transcriptional regulator|nr:TetR/AcrR family transcriptional regulator [Bacteroidales bacterium]
MMRKKELIEKCTLIFTSYGVKISADEISRMLGISKRTLYEIFESKENLVFECVNFTLERIHNIIDAHFVENKNNVIEKLFPFTNLKLQKLLVEDNRFLKDVRRLYIEIYRKTMEKHLDTFKKHIIEIIVEGIEENVFLPIINPEIIIDVLFLIHNALVNKMEFFEKYPPLDIFNNTILCFLRGISTPKGLELIEQTLGIEN